MFSGLFSKGERCVAFPVMRMITYSILENIVDEDEAAIGAFPTAAFWV
jgi:hypothetical protein